MEYAVEELAHDLIFAFLGGVVPLGDKNAAAGLQLVAEIGYGLGSDIVWHLAVKCLGNTAGDGGNGVGVAAQRYRDAYRVLKIRGFKECFDGLRHAALTGLIEGVALPDAVYGEVKLVVF